MRILMLGGSPGHLGGAEAFCERSREAMARQCDWEMRHIWTETSFLTLARIPIMLRGLWALMRQPRQEISCVWLQYVCLPDLVYLLAAKLRGHTVLVTPHLGSNWRSQANPVLRTLSWVLLSLADRFALISPTQELEIRLPKRTPRSYIRTFLPEDVLEGPAAEDGEGPQEIQLVHSGRLSEGKGTFRFLEVCRGLKEAGIEFQARVAGGADAKYYARIEEAIAAYDLRDRVHLLGRLPEQQLLEILRGSDVLVHLSTIDSYPLIVLESIACSTFPVCIDLPGASDMVHTFTGHVVPIEGAVDETVRFVCAQHVEQVRRLGKDAAWKVRRDYEWKQCAGLLQNALRDTVSGTPMKTT